MTQQQTENATKWLHTKNFNEIEPFRRLLFVLSHEHNNRRLTVKASIIVQVNYVTGLTLC